MAEVRAAEAASNFEALTFEARSPYAGQFMQELATMQEHPPGGDVRIAAFAQAAQAVIRQGDQEFCKQINDSLLKGRTEQAQTPDEMIVLTHSANKLLRACQKYARRSDWDREERAQFPHDFDKPAAWSHLFHWILHEDEWRNTEFEVDLRLRDVASNVPQRYATLPIAVNLLKLVEPGRFEEPPSILDAGASQNLGLIKIERQLPFRPIDVTKQESSGAVPDDDGTHRLNLLLEQGLQIGPSWGVDRQRPNDSGALEWARACERYPSEFMDEERGAELDELYRQQDSAQVGFNVWDFATEPKKGQLEFGEHSMDVVFVSNALYLVAADRRRMAVNNLLKFAKPNGLFVWLEFASQEHGMPRFFKNPHAKPYQHRAYVIDLAARHPKPSELIRYKNGRCLNAQTGRLFAAMAVPLDEK